MARELSKKLTSSEITSRYLWSTKWLECLPPFEEGVNRVSFKAEDRDGRVWEFTCSKRPNGPYRKPVLDGSTWLPFVRYKGLAAGDCVTFHYNPDEEGPIKFKIGVRRLEHVELMGHQVIFLAGHEE